MIGIQIITHGKMSEGIIDAAKVIIGNFENVEWNGLMLEDDIDVFHEEVLETTEQLLSDDGILIFVDMFGASPYNASLMNTRNIESDNYKVITGVNLPMLIEAISSRNTMNLEELYEHLINTGKETILGWEKKNNKIN